MLHRFFVSCVPPSFNFSLLLSKRSRYVDVKLVFRLVILVLPLHHTSFYMRHHNESSMTSSHSKLRCISGVASVSVPNNGSDGSAFMTLSGHAMNGFQHAGR